MHPAAKSDFWVLRNSAEPLTSHKLPRQNFSLLYQYNIKQTSDENKEKYQLGDYRFIQYQILQNYKIWTVWKAVRRITDEILQVTGLVVFEQEL